MEQRLCLECQQPLIGRADKKFCDDQCRSTYNNKMNAHRSQLIRQINGLLRKNRQVLIELCPTGKNRVKKDTLVARGFDMQYHTHTYQTKEGAVYHFCYDYGWLGLENDSILIVRND